MCSSDLENLIPEQMDNILNKLSGLKGLSGISNDMRVLPRKADRGNRRAQLALNVFTYRIKKYLGAYIAILGGCDAIVFTGGIGENQKSVRDDVCRRILCSYKKKPRVLVIKTNEELMIARQTYALIKEK